MRRRRSRRLPITILMVFVMFFTLAFLRNMAVEESEAASGFMAGNIVSDYVMGNHKAMTVEEIQAFLDSKNSCDVPLSVLPGGYLDGETYSITYSSGRTYKWHVKDGTFVCMAKEKFGDGGIIGEGKTAAQIIYDFAQEYKINPQVILVILEKEQALLSDGYPNNFDYGWALGFGAYDYGVWNTKYAGFKEQIKAAYDFYSWFLYEYDEDEAWWSYNPEWSETYIRLGQSNILYHPDTSCGYSSVNVENRATVSLYVYTPYQPNEAALAAGSGIGDYCSSYGNRNFYNYFTRWFGDSRKELLSDAVELIDKSANNILSWASYRTLLKEEGVPDDKLNRIETIFNIKDEITRENAIKILWEVFGRNIYGEDAFYDIGEYSLLDKLAIIWGYHNNITKYYSVEGEFAPESKVTRREVMIFLWRYAGEPDVDVGEVAGVFKDFPSDELGQKAVTWAYNNGITKYYSVEGEFAPESKVTRREVMIFLWRYAGEKVFGQEIFSDMPEGVESKVAIIWAYNNGITKYYSVEGEFAPYSIATVGEASIFISRAFPQ